MTRGLGGLLLVSGEGGGSGRTVLVRVSTGGSFSAGGGVPHPFVYLFRPF